MADRVGQQLGNYRLIQLLGRGGFAEVYLGEHIHLGTRAAIKVRTTKLNDAEVEKFRHEARTLARLEHPHIVRVLEFGLEESTPFLVMTYAPHGSLRSRHPKGTCVSLSTVVTYVKQVASALHYAHEAGLIHRDIKPSNMLVGRNQEILLSDFGMAMVSQSSEEEDSLSTQEMVSVQEMVGTMPYMAPEQFQGKPMPASDQYALAIAVYEWLSGERPFHGAFPEIAVKHSLTAPPSLHEKVPDIRPAVEAVILKALAKEPGQRYPTVLDFAAALEQVSQSNPDLDSGEETLFALSLGQAAKTGYALNSVKARPPSLPAQLNSLIGREREVAEVCTLLRRPEVRLVTLTGPGGIGKTRLGLQVVIDLKDEFAEEVCFVPLAPISDPDLVVPTIAKTLGLAEVGSQPLFSILKEYLQEKPLLLLLDNFEQIVAAAPRLTELLTACPHLKMLVTSRAGLHLTGEHEFPVPPLALPDREQFPESEVLSQYAAVALFTQRAQAVKPDFRVSDANAAAIAEICTRLDGLPLAIELAAARSKLLPPQALLARLERRLQMLTGGPRDAPARQQTLRDTIAWSYHLLDAQEQLLFRRLSVFVGGCTLEAAEAVCGGGDAIALLDGIGSLIDKNLLQQAEQKGDEPRIMMLETIREYGLECLTVSAEQEATQRVHAAYYLALAEEAALNLTGPEQAVWLERLEQEHDNLRAVIRWSMERVREERETALRLGGALWRFWWARGHLREGRSLLERVLSESAEVELSLRAKAVYAAGLLAWYQGDYDQAEALCGESLALYRELGDQQGIAYSLGRLGAVAMVRRNYATARSLFEESLAGHRKIGDKWGVAFMFATLSRLALSQGEEARSHGLLEESLTLFRELGDKENVAWLLLYLAGMVTNRRDYARASSLLQEGLALLREVGNKWGIAYALRLLGQLALSQGDTAQARSRFEESLALFRKLGHRQYVAQLLSLLAGVVAVQGDYTAAYAFYEESLTISKEGGYKKSVATSLEGLAGVGAAQGEPAWAARLWGAAEALREAIGVPMTPGARASYESSVAAARTQLGEAAFADRWAEGRTMSLEQVLTTVSPDKGKRVQEGHTPLED